MAGGGEPGAAPVRVPTVTVETRRSPDAEVSYFDGVAALSVGASVVKIDLFTGITTPTADGNLSETRTVDFVAVMPTLAFFEFVANSIEGALDNRALLSEALKRTLEQLGETAKRAAAKA